MHSISNEVFEAALANENNKRIINSVCRKYKKSISNEELKFRGYMALFCCLKKHSVETGTKFTSSLHRHAVWQCRKALRDERKYSPLPSMQFDYELATTTPSEVLEVNDCLDVLPYKYSKLLRSYYIERMTLQEIGSENGYTSVAAMQKLRQAEEAFRRLYSND